MTGSLISKLKSGSRLPSPPGAALRLLQLCQDDDVSIADLADTLAADPALSLRLLRYANSAIVGTGKRITSIREAVLLLGIRAVRITALSFSLVNLNDSRACRGFDYQRFWAHSVACATSARHLAVRLRYLSPEEAFVAGLLAHVGKLVCAVGIPEVYPKVLQLAGGTLARTERYEVAAIGTSHHDVGADLLLEWGVPEPLATAVRNQHCPRTAHGDELASMLSRILCSANDMADILCHAASDDVLGNRRQNLMNSGLIDGITEYKATMEAAQKDFMDLAQVLSISEGAQPTPGELQAEAGALLSDLSLAVHLQEETARAENRSLQQKATTDALTGIPNRADFDRQMNDTWQEMTRKGQPLAVVMIDVDHFKRFNDTFGHQTGDTVLKAVGQVLPTAVRSVDYVARYGGEEFVAILPNADRLTAAHVAVKIRKAIESCFVEADGQQHRVTVSVGAALLPRINSTFHPQALIEAADRQLYAAKQKGRNCCCMTQVGQTVPAATPQPPVTVAAC